MRRLRLGHPNGSLYKCPGQSTYTVDLSRLKHKTSRFCSFRSPPPPAPPPPPRWILSDLKSQLENPCGE